jgi:putative ABC transport system substrate-binding protein
MDPVTSFPPLSPDPQAACWRVDPRMARRTFLGTLGLSVLAKPLAAEAQPAGKVARIGYLVWSPIESPEARLTLGAFRQGLRERGYVEGQNIVIEYRSADGKIDRLPRLATELARLTVDLIVVGSTPSARAAQQATTTIPLVAWAMADPVGDGLVSSLGRPGGNITGLTFLGPELVPKRLGLLKEVLPKVTRVAALWNPRAFGERTTRDILKETEAAARALGLQLQLVEVRGPDELVRAFSTMTKERAEALVTFSSAMPFSEGRRLVDLVTKHRLPSIFDAREWVELGGLISYGASITDLSRRAAVFVDKILRGAKPADLPVEQPTKFVLVINLKTARALGLTIPPSLLARADQLIE